MAKLISRTEEHATIRLTNTELKILVTAMNLQIPRMQSKAAKLTNKRGTSGQSNKILQQAKFLNGVINEARNQ